MSENVKFSIIIPWRGGNEIREGLFRNMLNCLKVQDSNTDSEPIIYELIIVEHPDRPGDWDRRINSIVPDVLYNYKYIQLPPSKEFNKSWCMNVGARQSQYDHLLFMDADSLFGHLYLNVIRGSIRRTPSPHNHIMLCWNYLVGLPGKDNPIARHIQPHMLNTLGGIWYAEKSFYFNNFGGMNENYNGYGGEDNDGYERAIFAIGQAALSWMAYPLVHQYHDWEIPSNHAVKYFEATRRNPGAVNARLRAANVGNPEHSTAITMADLL